MNDKQDKIMISINYAVCAAYKKAQEITYQYCGKLVKAETPWYAIPLWRGLDKFIVKSIWRKYN